MKPPLNLLIVVTFFSLMIGCTGGSFVVHGPIHNGNTEGFPFYLPQPYLLVTQVIDQKTHNIIGVARIIYLPDLTQERFISIKEGSGKFEGSFKLEDGWKLTEINQKSDTKTTETLQAISSILKKVISPIPMLSLKKQMKKISLPAFHLYKIDITNNRLVEIKELEKKP